MATTATLHTTSVCVVCGFVYDEAAGTLSVVDEDIAGTAIVFSRA